MNHYRILSKSTGEFLGWIMASTSFSAVDAWAAADNRSSADLVAA